MWAKTVKLCFNSMWVALAFDIIEITNTSTEHLMTIQKMIKCHLQQGILGH